jgi:hypothetical protein
LLTMYKGSRKVGLKLLGSPIKLPEVVGRISLGGIIHPRML